jgi:hypothetical protein
VTGRGVVGVLSIHSLHSLDRRSVGLAASMRKRMPASTQTPSSYATKWAAALAAAHRRGSTTRGHQARASSPLPTCAIPPRSPAVGNSSVPARTSVAASTTSGSITPRFASGSPPGRAAGAVRERDRPPGRAPRDPLTTRSDEMLVRRSESKPFRRRDHRSFIGERQDRRAPASTIEHTIARPMASRRFRIDLVQGHEVVTRGRYQQPTGVLMQMSLHARRHRASRVDAVVSDLAK